MCKILGHLEEEVVITRCGCPVLGRGDGVFPASEFLQEQGTFAIGSDSHISVNPVEELRWLEYAQRLLKQQRAILADNTQPSVGQNLWQRAAKGGAQSTSTNTGELAVGKQADLLVLDLNKTGLFAHSEQHLLDSLVFASQQNMVCDVMIHGRWVVRSRQHELDAQASKSFSSLLKQLCA